MKIKTLKNESRKKRVECISYMHSFSKMIYVCRLTCNLKLACTSHSNLKYAQSTQAAVIYGAFGVDYSCSQ